MGYTFNPFTGKLDYFVAASSGGSGTVTSVASADGSVTVVNPTTTVDLAVVKAPKLSTARNINGVAFDGTASITVTADASTLTGTVLNATVVTSSLTAVGVIGTGTWQGTKVGLLYGGTNADLSGTGGAKNYLKQASAGAAITVGTIPASDIASGAALTKADDTNVTLTLGGTPATSLLVAASITAGWTGTLAVARGGTGGGTASITLFNNITGFSAAGTTGTTSTNLVFSTSPALTTPTVTSTIQIGTVLQAFGATNPLYIDVGTGNSTITTGALTALRYIGTTTVGGNSTSTSASVFNGQGTFIDDGVARTLGSAVIFASQFTYTATIAGGLSMPDYLGVLPAYSTLYHSPVFQRTGAGTGTATTVAIITSFGTVDIGFTVTNWYGMWFNAPTVNGTLTNVAVIKSTLAAATNRFFLQDTGGAQSQLAGKFTKYNNVNTSGYGLATVVASGRSTAQTAAVASVSTYTLPATDGSFEVSANVLVTTATAHNFTVTCAYTDEGNTARTLTFGFVQLTGSTFITAITNITGAGPYESPIFHIRCKASTAITIATTGTFTTVTYNVEGIIKQTA